MKLSHTRAATSAVFDDSGLVSSAGLVPLMALAESAGLAELAGKHLSVPTDKGARPGRKVTALVAGMAAGADSIDDLALLRHGGMGRLFHRPYAPSTLGSFLRAFTFGHVRQLDAVAARFLAGLAGRSPLLEVGAGRVLVDVDDTIIEVHGYAKQGAGFGYSKVRGLNALLATATTPTSAPVIVASRLRKGSTGSPRGAARLVTDALATLHRLPGSKATTRVLLRADSAFFGSPTVTAALRGGAEVSVTARLDRRVKAAIAGIAADAWTPIAYREAVYDETAGRWVSRAEVAEVGFTAFASRPAAKQVAGRLVVRRIPDLNPAAGAGQEPLFDSWRFHAFFTTSDLDTVTADRVHRGHAIIEQVHADLKTLRPRAPAFGQVRREQRLAGLCGDDVQPDPGRRRPRRRESRQSDHAHDPPHPGHRRRPNRHLGPPNHPAPTHRMALARPLDPALHPRLRTTHSGSHLTAQPAMAQPGRPVEHPRSEAGHTPAPAVGKHPDHRHNSVHQDHRWIEAKDTSTSGDERPVSPAIGHLTGPVPRACPATSVTTAALVRAWPSFRSSSCTLDTDQDRRGGRLYAGSSPQRPNRPRRSRCGERPQQPSPLRTKLGNQPPALRLSGRP